MADNVAITPGAGAAIATDDVSGVHYQRVKIVDGTDGSTNPLVVDSSGRIVAKISELIDVAGTGVALKYVRVNATADGDNTVLAAVSGKKFRVLGYVLTVTAAGTITIKDGAATTYAQFALPANGGVSYPGGRDAPAFETTTANSALIINNPASVDTVGHLVYVEV